MSLVESGSGAAVDHNFRSYIGPSMSEPTREQHISQLLSPRPAVGAEVEIKRAASPDVIVLIPLHNDARRYDTAELAIASLRNQGIPQEGLHIVIADNGMTQEGVNRMRAAAETQGIDITMVNAHPHPTIPEQKSPAYARNKGLEHIKGVREQDSRFLGSVFELDSDNVLASGALSHLRDTLHANDRAAAVSGQLIPVQRLEDVDPDTRENLHRGDVRILPTLWDRNGNLDLASIVAFSSQVAGKTTGLMLSPDVLWRVTDYSKLYVSMPGKSAEDMVAAAALGRHGDIYYDSRARIYDEARTSVGDTEKQQYAWGRDHSILANDLQRARLVNQGIQVLEPRDGKWVQWTVPARVPGYSKVSGFVINPEDTALTAKNLHRELRSGDLAETLSLDASAKTDLQQGLMAIAEVGKVIQEARPHVKADVRYDLPAPTAEDVTNPRFSPVAKLARLAGNITGAFESADETKVPDAFVFGGRQSAQW